MTIGWTVSLFEFILGTLTLWICSQTVDTPNSNIKTAAIYNVMLQILSLSMVGIMFITKPNTIGIFVLTFSIAFIISFFLLKIMYGTSIFSTTWLVIACWVIKAGAKKIIATIL